MFLVLVSNIYASTSQLSTTRMWEKLVLNKELAMFEACSVHLVIEEIQYLVGKGKSKIRSYELEPLNFPIIISNPRYIILGPQHIDPRKSCFVRVHIDPSGCKDLRYRGFLKSSSGSVSPIYHRLSATYLNPVFDQKLLHAIELGLDSIHFEKSMSEAVSGEMDFKIFKSGLIFIHVEIQKKRSHYRRLAHANSVLYFAEHLYKERGFSVSSPLRFVIGIEYSEEAHSFLSKYMMSPTCWEYREAVKYSDGDISDLWFTYVRRVFQKITVTTETNWKYFESLQSKCSSEIPMYVGVRDLDNMEKYHQDVRSWEGKDSNVHVASRQVLFKNVSLATEPPEGGIVFTPLTKTIAASEIIYNSIDDAAHFITCAPTQVPGFLSLLGYISAFDLTTWLMLLVTGLGSGLLLQTILWKAQKVSKYDWYPVAFVLSILLGQGNRFIHLSRLIGGCWVLSGIVISFFYQGENINRLTAPLSPKNMETFEELLKSNFTIHSVESNKVLLQEIQNVATYAEIRGPKYVEKFLKDYKKKYSKIVQYWVLFTQLHYFNNRNLTLKQVNEKLTGRLIVPRTYEEMVEQLNEDYLYDIIQKCGFEAIIDRQVNIKAMETRLKSGGVRKSKIAISKSPYGFLSESWMFQEIPWPPIPFLIKVRSLLQSGLVPWWRSWVVRYKSWNSTVVNAQDSIQSVKPMSTSDNFVVVFCIHSVVIAISVLVLLAEFVTKVTVRIPKRFKGGKKQQDCSDVFTIRPVGASPSTKSRFRNCFVTFMVSLKRDFVKGCIRKRNF
ncbi:unnamed protein product [Orchesella dallaii]|uniref:Uncharacterized protein n=1 Tax=Orchesella dallaii TaxID=48710 RepID=A0ABP1RZV6_9HEXA